MQFTGAYKVRGAYYKISTLTGCNCEIIKWMNKCISLFLCEFVSLLACLITMSSVVQQGLILRDRIFTVSVLLPDKPGELCKVSGIIAAQQGNVIKLEHNQFVTTNRSAAVELRITLECFGTDHKKQIIKALEKEGYKPKVVRTSL